MRQERTFVRNGITLLSGLYPERRCERVADAVSVLDRTLYFCPSPLYGYGLERLLSRLEAEAPNSAVLCIEADPELYELSQKNIDPSLAAKNNLRITNIRDVSKLCAFARETWGARAFRRIETVRLTGGWQLFGELYDSLFAALRADIGTDWSNALTLTKLGRLYIRNFLRNLRLIPRFPSVKELSFGNAPVFVLGAGPSLDETLDALEKHFGETIRKSVTRSFRIICVDTCLGTLKARNIVPDLVVILESQHWNMGDFTGCRGWKVPAAVDLSALPQSAEILEGDGFLFMTPWTSLRIFERLKAADILPVVFPPLGSVGLTSVKLAMCAGQGNIICAGIDFSYTSDKYHARGTPGHISMLNTNDRFHTCVNAAAYENSAIAAVSKNGLPVKTSPVMRNYRGLFEQEFGGETRLFDITGSGLSLGLKTLSLNEVFEKLAANDTPPKTAGNTRNNALVSEKVKVFIDVEKKRLIDLRDILTGEAAADNFKLNLLISECDYLWAHFPDFAGAGHPPLETNSQEKLSFLNRVRVEIDLMLKAF